MSYISKIQSIIQNKLAPRSTGATVGAGGVAISSSSGSYTFSSTTFATVSNQNITITTTGRPVAIIVTPDATTGISGYFETQNSDSMQIQIVRGSTVVYFTYIGVGSQILIPGNIFTMDPVAAGTYTYSLQSKSVSGGLMAIVNVHMVVYEI